MNILNLFQCYCLLVFYLKPKKSLFDFKILYFYQIYYQNKYYARTNYIIEFLCVAKTNRE